MSIDLYPHLDLQSEMQGTNSAVGAASLLYRNDSSLWPEFDQRDLLTCFPGLQHQNLAEDGATTFDILNADHLNELAQYRTSNSLVTLTIGGNDALEAVLESQANNYAELQEEIEALLDRLDECVKALLEALPLSKIILGTIYDPTDGTGLFPDQLENSKKLPIEFLDVINKHIRSKKDEQGILIADIHRHFLGHGTLADPESRWYWHHSPIEPSAKGANEIRRVWINALISAKLLN